MNHLILNDLCQLAISAAHQAGSVIDYYRDLNVTVERKAISESETTQVVTEADFKAQKTILETLAPSIEQYDLAVLAEESADDGMRFKKSAFWCIDPMDGTLAFIKGLAGFAVSIALVSKDGEPLIGVVYDPVSQDTYHAIKGAGAFRNNKPLLSPELDPDFPLVLRTDISFRDHRYLPPTQNGVKQISAQLGLSDALVDFRIGAVMNALAALTEKNHCYFKYARTDNSGGSIWDYAATACLFNEAGAIASDIYGQSMDLNRSDSSFMNHRGIVYSPTWELSEQIIQLGQTVQKES